MPESNALKDKFWQGQIERDTCKMLTVRAHQRILENSPNDRQDLMYRGRINAHLSQTLNGI